MDPAELSEELPGGPPKVVETAELPEEESQAEMEAKMGSFVEGVAIIFFLIAQMLRFVSCAIPFGTLVPTGVVLRAWFYSSVAWNW